MKKKNSKSYNNDWPIVAICYDFDKTLSPKDMQEFSLIPKLNCSSKDFWEESNGLAKREGMERSKEIDDVTGDVSGIPGPGQGPAAAD